jgi:hypothetical protein
MDKKLSSIEWLVEKTFSDFGKSVKSQEIKMAIEMHNQEIIDAYESGQKDTANGFFIKSGNKYLKDKYK